MTKLEGIAEAVILEKIRHAKAIKGLRKSFGDQMRVQRIAKGLSIRELGRIINLSAGFLSDVELGRRSLSWKRIKEVLETI